MTRRVLAWLLILLQVAGPAFAANHYVRAGAGGTASGNDWTNAYTALPAALTRGDTYYIADGSYAGYTFDDATSGTTLITIKKATIADHGVSTGWLDTYGDGQASFGVFDLVTDYYVLDGISRTESDWDAGSAYGIHATGLRASVPNNGAASSHVTAQYLDIGGTDGAICHYLPSTSCDAGVDTVGSIYLNGSTITDWTVSRVRMHNTKVPVMLLGVSNVTIEQSWIGPSWGKETIRGGNSGSAKNITIRYNKLVNSCKGDPTDVTGDRCTAHIAIWDTSIANDLDNVAIYGNLILEMSGYTDDRSGGTLHTDGCISIGGNGTTWAGVATNSSKIYNNTIVGVLLGPSSNNICTVGMAGSGTGNTAYNNIWYGVTASTGCVSGATCANNGSIGSGSQFVNALTAYPATGFDYHLASATAAGTSLSAPYNADPDGITRGGDGTWDRGAYEFGTVALSTINSLTGSLTLSGVVLIH